MKPIFLRFMSLAAGWFAPAIPPLAVELLIYSGRPNPSFAITDASAVKDILATALKLPPDPASTLPPSWLGYQGFLVRHQRATFIVYHSTVQLIDVAGAPPARAHRIDARATLESKLIEHARRQHIIDDSLIALIREPAPAPHPPS